MLHRLLTALALVCVIAMPSHAHPNYPGLDRQRVSISSTSKEAAKINTRRKSAVALARRDLGTNPSGWLRLWCARQMNLWERKAGRKGTGSALAKSFASYGKAVPLARAKPGDIVVTKRRGGHHVGYLVAKQGKTVRLISGNSGGAGPGRRVVAEGNYPVSRIIAVRRPA